LHVNTAVFLLKSPVGVESPKIASAITDWPFFAIWTVWVLDLSDLCADGM
jgi:hypothetical protein